MVENIFIDFVAIGSAARRPKITTGNDESLERAYDIEKRDPRQGRCLTCAGQLLEGVIENNHADEYFAEDKEENCILLCHAIPRSDVRILTHQWEMREHCLAKGLPAPYA